MTNYRRLKWRANKVGLTVKGLNGEIRPAIITAGNKTQGWDATIHVPDEFSPIAFPVRWKTVRAIADGYITQINLRKKTYLAEIFNRKLWVDTQRSPPDDSWSAAHTSQTAIEWLSTHVCDILSLEHNLQGHDTTHYVVHWLRDNDIWPDEIRIHTPDSVGAAWLQRLCEGYCEVKLTPCDDETRYCACCGFKSKNRALFKKYPEHRLSWQQKADNAKLWICRSEKRCIERSVNE